MMIRILIFLIVATPSTAVARILKITAPKLSPASSLVLAPSLILPETSLTASISLPALQPGILPIVEPALVLSAEAPASPKVERARTAMTVPGKVPIRDLSMTGHKGEEVFADIYEMAAGRMLPSEVWNEGMSPNEMKEALTRATLNKIYDQQALRPVPLTYWRGDRGAASLPWTTGRLRVQVNKLNRALEEGKVDQRALPPIELDKVKVLEDDPNRSFNAKIDLRQVPAFQGLGETMLAQSLITVKEVTEKGLAAILLHEHLASHGFEHSSVAYWVGRLTNEILDRMVTDGELQRFAGLALQSLNTPTAESAAAADAAFSSESSDDSETPSWAYTEWSPERDAEERAKENSEDAEKDSQPKDPYFKPYTLKIRNHDPVIVKDGEARLRFSDDSQGAELVLFQHRAHPEHGIDPSFGPFAALVLIQGDQRLYRYILSRDDFKTFELTDGPNLDHPKVPFEAITDKKFLKDFFPYFDGVMDEYLGAPGKADEQARARALFDDFMARVRDSAPPA